MGGICSAGAGTSHQEAESDLKIQDQMREDHEKEARVHKLLFLGAGESGKSTLFKQMRQLYGDGYEKKDLLAAKPIIFLNLIETVNAVCAAAKEMDQEHPERNTKMSKEALEAEEYLETSSAVFRTLLDVQYDAADNPILKPEDAVHIRTIINDEGIKNTRKFPRELQLIESFDYFFEKLDSIVDPDFVPTYDDLLRSRIRTTGIIEKEFTLQGKKFLFIDVGGQRNERKKWLHCFSDVTAVIFVVSLSGYDILLFEDEETNRLHESLDVFEEYMNKPVFQNTDIILFLNKADLFAQKIKKTPLSVAFPTYKLPECPENFDEENWPFQNAIDYITEQFRARNSHKERQVFPHVTCATDSNQMKEIFWNVRDIVIERSLRQVGLVDEED